MAEKNEIKISRADFDDVIGEYKKTIKTTKTKTIKTKTTKKVQKKEKINEIIQGDDEYLEIINKYLLEIKCFNDDQLLNVNYIKVLLYTEYNKVKAKILAEFINKKVIISRDKVYMLDEKYNTYTNCADGLTENVSKKVVSLCVSLATDSLSFIEKNSEIPADVKEQMSRILSNGYYTALIQDIFDYLRNDDISFDEYSNKLHFKNGYLKLTENTLKIYPRVIGDDYITKYIKRDFKPPSNDAVKWLDDVLNKIYAEREKSILWNIFENKENLIDLMGQNDRE